MASQLTSPAGGENTPLHDTSFEGITPRKQIVQTPNVVLGTPFRTPGGQSGQGGATPGRMVTPLMGGTGKVGPPGSSTPSQTPLRDQLNINLEENMSGFEGVKSARQQQLEIRAQLRAGLSSLPAPKNDFEIVIPEDEGGMEVEDGSEVDPYFVDDAAEVDERRAKALKAAGEL